MSTNIKKYFNLLNDLKNSSDELDVDNEELNYIIRPSNEEISKKAFEIVLDEHDLTKDQITIDNPQDIVLAAEKEFYKRRDDIIEEIERIMELERGNVTGADIDTMLYIVDKNAGKTGQFTILGGAESFIYNLAHQNNWHPLEVDLIIEANKIAGRENGLHRHYILDIAIIIPNDKEMLYN